MKSDGIADGYMQPLEVGDLRSSTVRAARCAARGREPFRRVGLLCPDGFDDVVRACSVQSAAGPDIPPVVSEFTVTSGRITSNG